MKIGINLLWVRPNTGINTHVQELLGALSRIDSPHRFLLFVNRDNYPDFENLDERFKRVVCNVPAESRARKLIWEQLWLARQASREQLALIHSVANTAPLIAPCPNVLTVHDVGAFAFPEMWSRWRGSVLRFATRSSARRATAIVVVSEFSRREVISHLGVAGDKVFVVHNGVAPPSQVRERSWQELHPRLGINSDYIFAYSGPSSHKNLGSLLTAFARVQSKHGRRQQLVIVGKLPLRGPELPGLASELGIAESVVFTGYLDDADAASLLKHATLMAFPSLYEGFGLPVLEAMQAGVPVACSNAASMPEVAGQAALYFNPRDTDEMAQAISRLLSDRALRDRLIAEGRNNIRRFSWRETARRTLEVYRLVLSGPLMGRAQQRALNSDRSPGSRVS